MWRILFTFHQIRCEFEKKRSKKNLTTVGKKVDCVNTDDGDMSLLDITFPKLKQYINTDEGMYLLTHDS